MRIRGIGTVLVACMALALAACGSDDGSSSGGSSDGSSGSGTKQVRVLINDPLYNSNYADVVAQEAGFFAKNGLDVEFVPAQQPITPLFSGDVDITSAGLAPALTAKGQNQDIKVVAKIIPRFAGVLLAPKGSDLASKANQWPAVVQALQGKKLGVTVAGATIDNQARYMLDLAGLKPDEDVQVLALGGGTPLVAAVEQGRVDAALVPDPLYEQLLERGKADMLMNFIAGDGPDELKVPYALSWTTGDYTEKNPDILRAYVKAINKAFAYMKDPANADKATDMLASYQESVPRDLVRKSLDAFNETGPSSAFTPADLDRGLALMKANGLLKDDISYDDIVATPAKADWDR